MRGIHNVLITGAGGIVGTVLRRGLRDSYQISGLDRRRGREWQRQDVRRLRSVRNAFEGIDAVVDLAAKANLASPWRDVQRYNVPATLTVLEAAQQAGVRRVVFASSNHVVGLYERDHPYAAIVAGKYDGLDPAKIPKITSRHPVRPDSPYAIGKLIGEAAGRYYSETHALSVFCLRIGTVRPDDVPSSPRVFATLLTHADLTRLVDCCLRAPEDRLFGIYYGVSANTWRFWDHEEAVQEIGYEPKDNAERLRARSTVPR
jgi:nucleoside-diphosphate-sugar epimerase